MIVAEVLMSSSHYLYPQIGELANQTRFSRLVVGPYRYLVRLFMCSRATQLKLK
jgi:hypothetical protein